MGGITFKHQLMMFGVAVFCVVSMSRRCVFAEGIPDHGKANRPHIAEKEFPCSESKELTCTCTTYLKFSSQKTDYFAGYCEDKGHMGHRQIWLCYDKDRYDGHNECSQSIQPQPQIGDMGSDDVAADRIPYELLIESVDQETGPDKAQYLTAKLWLQDGRTLTAQERMDPQKKIEPPGNESSIGDFRYRPELPVTHFTLRYRFVMDGEKVAFEPTRETQDAIKRITDKTTLRK